MSSRVAYITWQFGLIEIIGNEEEVVYITLVKDKLYPDNAIGEVLKAKNQIIEYLNKEREIFDINLRLDGTEFQKKAWNALIDIPYGETRTYKQQAEAVGNPNASRAVGGANNKNKLAIVIPCHRVVGANNKLVGYAGGIEIKEYLLALEQNERK